MKIPSHEYEATVSFYRNIIGLAERSASSSDPSDNIVFQFGDKILWIDRVPGLSQAEIWLELVADDMEAAAKHLEAHGIVRRDEIEPLPDGFKGFWVCSPSNIIHLVTSAAETE